MRTSPRTPSSSKIWETTAEARGTSSKVYVCCCDSLRWRLIWSGKFNGYLRGLSDAEQTCNDFGMLNKWAAQVDDIRDGGGERTRLKPKHLIDSMLLFHQMVTSKLQAVLRALP